MGRLAYLIFIGNSVPDWDKGMGMGDDENVEHG